MAAIDYDSITETTRQHLLAATYKMALEYFQDPDVEARYQIWLAERRARDQQQKEKK